MTEPFATPDRPVALAMLLMGLFGVGLMVWSQQESAPASNDVDALPAASPVKPAPPRPPVPTLAEGPAPAQRPDEAYVTTESGLRYVDLVEASGPPITPGQVALVHYTMWLEDGTRIDSSLSRNKPVRLQTHQTVASLKGWIEGVSSMGVGGHRQLVLSPDLAYGDHGRGTVIPPNATLIIEVTVEGVED